RRTEPEAFYLDVFFNAQPTAHYDANKRHKPSNALVPTSIAYAGGQATFAVDMGLDFATRLMILKGNFTSISLAIYGELASDPPPATYPEPKQLPSVEPSPLLPSLDPSNSPDPTSLAKQLLTLIDDAPPLPLLIRLMFCLKPSNEDWENPDFPYLYADLDYAADAQHFDLQEAYAAIGRPIADDTSAESFVRFAEKVASCIEQKNSDQTYYLSGILARAASQHPALAPALLERVDLETIMEPSHMDSSVLQRLLTACTNPIIAGHLQADWFLSLLSVTISNPAVESSTKANANKLKVRILGWPILEDALSNTQADFSLATQLLREIGCEEQSFGVWLACEVMHEDLRTKLAENSVMPFPLLHPPALFRSELAAAGVSHDEFIAFLRAYLGVACVLAVFAWSDSLGSKVCRERTLAVIRLWQEVDGYREIVNHLLLLRQMVFRLECNLNNDPPTSSGISTERILLSLASYNPGSMLSPDMIKCSLNLQHPLSAITEDERLTMRRLAIIAEDGAPAAVEVLGQRYESPMKMEDIRSIRVSLTIMERELENGVEGEWRALEALWGERRHGLVTMLAEALSVIISDIRSFFSLRPPPETSQHVLAELFETARDLLKVMVRLVPAYPLPSRPMCMLVADIADLFVCTDSADMLYSQASPACIAAQSSRQACIDAVRTLCQPSEGTPLTRHDGKSNACVVLRTLLEHGLRCGDTDPAYHILQVFSLIDHLLPFAASPGDEGQAMWLREVLPNVLSELKVFFRALDTDNRVHFAKRLANLDSGVLGIGEWLVSEELSYLENMMKELQGGISDGGRTPRTQFTHCQVSSSLKFVCDLVAAGNTSPWCLQYLTTDPVAVASLKTSLSALLDLFHWSEFLIGIGLSLSANWARNFDQSLGVVIVQILLRDQDVSPGNQRVILDLAWNVLQDVDRAAVDSERVRVELSSRLAQMARSLDQSLTLEPEDPTPDLLLSITEWLIKPVSSNESKVCLDLTANHLSNILQRIKAGSTQNRTAIVENLEGWISVSGDEKPVSLRPLPDHFILSVHDLEGLLQDRMDVDVPSTPPQKPLSHSQDVFGLVTVSPPTALLRSPAVTGLTKTYANNDFRQLRQTPSARQNTSRLPSMHVDVGAMGPPEGTMLTLIYYRNSS
ncbi:hypothetical protein GLOTRDRAFT_33360, partial [Gloeophyllum trabeum ATCC 11539]